MIVQYQLLVYTAHFLFSFSQDSQESPSPTSIGIAAHKKLPTCKVRRVDQAGFWVVREEGVSAMVLRTIVISGKLLWI